MVCAFVAMLMLVYIVLYKAYASILQRLFLFLIITSFLSEAVKVGMIDYQWYYDQQKDVCRWLGFLNNWLNCVVFVLPLEIIMYMVFLVYCLVKNDPFPWVSRSKRTKICLEFVYITIPIVVLFAFAWGPFVHNNYGLAGPMCWIRTFKNGDENCTNIGLHDQIVFGYALFEGTGIIGVFLMVVIALVYSKLAVTLRDARLLLRKALILITVLLVYILTISLPFFIRIYTALTGKYTNFTMWTVLALSLPLCQLIFPCGYFACFFTLSFKSLQRATRWCCIICIADQSIPIRADLSNVYGTTLPESTRISQPSNTFFNLSYTNGFTHMSTDHSLLLPDNHNFL